MKNWSVNLRELKKDKEAYKIWRLEQLINFGVDKEKLSKKDLLKYLSRLNIDPYKKKLLELVIYGKKRHSQ
ncbi:MAG: hypothetical protein KatS3mg095_0645 [Candidatus Parcubacteria bacterium]|nr:MAG: hypothetical protein KatS3mg095_0645 [Candidatus Parcubacteria bacterium]